MIGTTLLVCVFSKSHDSVAGDIFVHALVFVVRTAFVVKDEVRATVIVAGND